jgi:hypothetical protein
MSKVPVQKGKINPSEPTSKMMRYEDKVSQSRQEKMMKRDSMMLKMHTPKK